MKRAKVHTQRRLADDRRMVQIVCPVCDGRHWMRAAAGDIAHCPRGLPGQFIIGAKKRKRRSNVGAWS